MQPVPGIMRSALPPPLPLLLTPLPAGWSWPGRLLRRCPGSGAPGCGACGGRPSTSASSGLVATYRHPGSSRRQAHTYTCAHAPQRTRHQCATAPCGHGAAANSAPPQAASHQPAVAERRVPRHEHCANVGVQLQSHHFVARREEGRLPRRPADPRDPGGVQFLRTRGEGARRRCRSQARGGNVRAAASGSQPD